VRIGLECWLNADWRKGLPIHWALNHVDESADIRSLGLNLDCSLLGVHDWPIAAGDKPASGIEFYPVMNLRDGGRRYHLDV